MKETFFGDGYTNYDAKGNKIGRSERNFFGDGFTNYDAKGKKIGKSKKTFLEIVILIMIKMEKR